MKTKGEIRKFAGLHRTMIDFMALENLEWLCANVTHRGLELK